MANHKKSSTNEHIESADRRAALDFAPVIDRAHDVPDLVPFTFNPGSDSNVSVGVTLGSDDYHWPPQPSQSSIDIASRPSLTFPNSIVFPTCGSAFASTDSTTPPSNSQSAFDDIWTNPSAPPGLVKSNAKLIENSFTDHQIHESNPFLFSSQLDINMPPSLSSVIDNLLDDKSVKVDLDSVGCALLPASEYILTLESDCDFYYEFWDGYSETQFCFPIDLALHLEPSRAKRYDFYALAVPMIPKIAVRITSIAVPTRFSRLTPKPPPPLPQSSANTPPNQIYTTCYRGCTIGSPKPPPKSDEKAPEPEPITPERGIHLFYSWERITSKRVWPASPSSWTRGGGGTCKSAGASHMSELNAEVKRTELLAGDKRGFVLRAWIPVPMSLFENKETCTFRVDARVWVEDSYIRVENSRSLIPKPRRYRPEKGGPRWEVGEFSGDAVNRNTDDRMLEASRMVIISHLQRERDMR